MPADRRANTRQAAGRFFARECAVNPQHNDRYVVALKPRVARRSSKAADGTLARHVSIRFPWSRSQST
jgi:hypothetical protein